MRFSFWPLLVALFVAAPAFAQKVVILEFENDKKNKLRKQVEEALEEAGEVKIVSINRWKELADKKKLDDAAAMTPAGVAKIGRAAKIDAAVEGVVGDKFFVRILDANGNELWSKELKMDKKKKGMLTPEFAGKLAKAIKAAADTAPKAGDDEEEAAPPPEKPEKTEPERAKTDAPRGDRQATVGGDGSEGIDLTAATPDLSEQERDKRRREEEAEANSASSHVDEDLANEGKKKKQPNPRFFRFTAYILDFTWRSYCSRPGVESCREYENKDPKPEGSIVNFSADVPYYGFQGALEVFPLYAFTDKWWGGLGLLGEAGLGFSRIIVKVQQGAAETMGQEVVSRDISYAMQLTFRPHFRMLGDWGWAGIRGGFGARLFEVDPEAKVPLPGAARFFPMFGFDVAVPLGSKYARAELGLSFMFNPTPGQDVIIGYGNFSDSTGGAVSAFPNQIQLDVGLGGEIWGPLGYRAKFRHTRFSDRFYGQGTLWTRCDDTQCGGAAEEVYSTVYLGAVLAF